MLHSGEYFFRFLVRIRTTAIEIEAAIQVETARGGKDANYEKWTKASKNVQFRVDPTSERVVMPFDARLTGACTLVIKSSALSSALATKLLGSRQKTRSELMQTLSLALHLKCQLNFSINSKLSRIAKTTRAFSAARSLPRLTSTQRRRRRRGLASRTLTFCIRRTARLLTNKLEVVKLFFPSFLCLLLIAELMFDVIYGRWL